MGKIRQGKGYSGCWGGAAILHGMTRVAPRRGLRGGEGSNLWVSGSDHRRGGGGEQQVPRPWGVCGVPGTGGQLCVWRVERWGRVAETRGSGDGWDSVPTWPMKDFGFRSESDEEPRGVRLLTRSQLTRPNSVSFCL